MATQASPVGQQQLTPAQANAIARSIVLEKSLPRLKLIYTNTFAPSEYPTLNIPPHYVGLIRRFLVRIDGTIQNSSATNPITLTNFGISNLFKNQGGIIFTDLQNYQRHNTNGWHLTSVASAKHRKPWASGYALETDQMLGFGENFPILSVPSSIAASSSGTFTAYFEIPISYGPHDLRGAIYANVVSATANLQLNFNNTNFVAGSGASSTFSVYSSADATPNASITSMTVRIYQDFLDQLPVGPHGLILPMEDISKMYRLENTFLPNITANVDNPLTYSNMRKFISTIAVYDNAGVLNNGSDIDYWQIVAANYVDRFKVDPLTQSIPTREIVGTDLPKGMYYFSHREHPIETVQSGNTALVINPSSASAGATLYVGYEDFSTPQLLSQAGTLSS